MTKVLKIMNTRSLRICIPIIELAASLCFSALYIAGSPLIGYGMGQIDQIPMMILVIIMLIDGFTLAEGMILIFDHEKKSDPEHSAGREYTWIGAISLAVVAIPVASL